MSQFLPQHVGWYLIVFTALSFGGLLPVLNLEVRVDGTDDWSSSFVEVIRHMREVVIVSAAYSFVVVEGVTMLAEIFLKGREKRGEERGKRMAERELANMNPEELERRLKEVRRQNSDSRVED